MSRMYPPKVSFMGDAFAGLQNLMARKTALGGQLHILLAIRPLHPRRVYGPRGVPDEVVVGVRLVPALRRHRIVEDVVGFRFPRLISGRWHVC